MLAFIHSQWWTHGYLLCYGCQQCFSVCLKYFIMKIIDVKGKGKPGVLHLWKLLNRGCTSVCGYSEPMLLAWGVLGAAEMPYISDKRVWTWFVGCHKWWGCPHLFEPVSSSKKWNAVNWGRLCVDVGGEHGVMYSKHYDLGWLKVSLGNLQWQTTCQVE